MILNEKILTKHKFIKFLDATANVSEMIAGFWLFENPPNAQNHPKRNQYSFNPLTDFTEHTFVIGPILAWENLSFSNFLGQAGCHVHYFMKLHLFINSFMQKNALYKLKHAVVPQLFSTIISLLDGKIRCLIHFETMIGKMNLSAWWPKYNKVKEIT